MMEKLTRILYVEDEPDIQTVARLALETLGVLRWRYAVQAMRRCNGLPDFNHN